MKIDKVSPLAPKSFPRLAPIKGLRLASAQCGIRYKGRTDAALFLFDKGTTIAGVFTRSLSPSAPVDWCRAAIRHGEARAILVNSGNANAFTGKLGVEAVADTVDSLAGTLKCEPWEVMVASTGVIGEPLPADKLTAKVGALVKSAKANSWTKAARAIMTTDTFPKGAEASCKIDRKTVRVAGIAKGSGMIAPDMATMLAFVVTDAAVAPRVLNKLLAQECDVSFNAITVDSDTSTSDSLFLAATGKAKHAPITRLADPRLAPLRLALRAVLVDLACQVVRDGEGASKFVTVDITGAESNEAARRIGLAVANSPLVKTAIAGEDANWGRIVMAVGKAGERAERDRLAIDIGGICVAREGQRVAGYDEAPVARHMKGQEISIAVDVGVGRGQARVWTCDLTHGYIAINGDYRS